MAGSLRCVIVDDEPLARELLRSMLSELEALEVVAEYGDGDSAADGLLEHDPDLLFLDVQMPGLTGLEVLRELGDGAPEVIFVTAYDQYALRAFEVDAVDYLLKPFDDERLAEAVERARRRLGGSGTVERTDRLLDLLDRIDRRGQHLERLAVKDGERTLLLPVSGIEWLEAEGKYIRIHRTDGESHLIRQTMKSLEEALDPERFLRVSRSAILNIDRVAEIHAWFNGDFVVTMAGGHRINTTRSYRAGLKRVMENR